MRRLVIALASAAAMTVAANATDLPRKAPAYKAPPPPPPALTWAGWYIGIDGGWGRGHYGHDFNIAGHYNLGPGDTFDYSKNGAVLGGHLGYNWQFGQWVFGGELGMMRSWIEAADVISPFFPATDRFSSKVAWIGTVTPRLGYAFGNILLYGKGGLAVGRVNDTISDNLDFVDFKSTRAGWTAGAGLEYMLMPNWIVGLEYNHYDFGSANVNVSSTVFASGATFFPGTNHDFKATVDAVQGRLSYKFGNLWP